MEGQHSFFSKLGWSTCYLTTAHSCHCVFGCPSHDWEAIPTNFEMGTAHLMIGRDCVSGYNIYSPPSIRAWQLFKWIKTGATYHHTSAVTSCLSGKSSHRAPPQLPWRHTSRYCPHSRHSHRVVLFPTSQLDSQTVNKVIEWSSAWPASWTVKL